MTTFEFYHDFGSMNAYFAHMRIPEIERKTGARALYRPILLGGIFKATDNTAPFMAHAHIPSKVAYVAREHGRYAERYQIPYLRNPHFPILSVPHMRAVTFAIGKPYEAKLTDVLYRGFWAEGLNMTDLDVVAELLRKSDLPAEEILAGAQTPEVKETLRTATEAAVTRGVFGSPTLFVGTEMFFGKESLLDLEDELMKAST